MAAIQDYPDYRIFLKEQLSLIREQKPCYSYRRIAQKFDIDPGTLVKILHGKRHISKRLIPLFASFLGLSEIESEYFACLVNFNKAKTISKKQFYSAQLSKFKQT